MGFGSILPKEEARITKARNAASKIRVGLSLLLPRPVQKQLMDGWCVSQLQRTRRNWRLSCAGWDFAIEWQVRVLFVWSLATHKILNSKQVQRQLWQFGAYVNTMFEFCGIGWFLRGLLPVSKLGCPHLVGLLRNLGNGLTLPFGFGCLLTQVPIFGAMKGIMLLISFVKLGDIFGGRNIWCQGAMKSTNFQGTLSDLKRWLMPVLKAKGRPSMLLLS